MPPIGIGGFGKAEHFALRAKKGPGALERQYLYKLCMGTIYGTTKGAAYGRGKNKEC